MPNIMIHEKVAYLVAQKYKDLDTGNFYLGAMAPDAINLNGFASKEERWYSHLRSKDLQEWRSNIINFYYENLTNYPLEFITGYLIHILTDIIFDDKFYKKLKDKIDPTEDISKYHQKLLKYMDYYFKVNETSKEWLYIKEKLMNVKTYNIRNITPNLLLKWKAKQFTLKHDNYEENNYINDNLIKELTKEVIIEYEEIKRKC